MAKNKGKTRKQNKPMPQMQANQQPSLWRRIPGWFYFLLVFSTLVVTILEGVPWLSIDEGNLLDSQNPFSALFSVTNGGYIPVTNLDANCILSFRNQRQNVSFTQGDFSFTHFADYIAHSGRATLPCWRSIDIKNIPLEKAEMKVIVTYSLYPFTSKVLRRHQTFNFEAIKANDGSLHWTYVS